MSSTVLDKKPLLIFSPKCYSRRVLIVEKCSNLRLARLQLFFHVVFCDLEAKNKHLTVKVLLTFSFKQPHVISAALICAQQVAR